MNAKTTSYEEVINALQCRMPFDKVCIEAYDLIKQLEAKNMNLMFEKEKLLKECKQNGIKMQQIISKLQEQIKTTKFEAYEEFSNKIEETTDINSSGYILITKTTLNNFVKELMEN